MHQIQFSVIKKPHKNLKTPTYIVLIEPQNKMRPVIKYWYMLLYHVYSLGSSLSFHQALVQNLLILRQKNVYKNICLPFIIWHSDVFRFLIFLLLKLCLEVFYISFHDPHCWYDLLLSVQNFIQFAKDPCSFD